MNKNRFEAMVATALLAGLTFVFMYTGWCQTVAKESDKAAFYWYTALMCVIVGGVFTLSAFIEVICFQAGRLYDEVVQWRIARR